MGAVFHVKPMPQEEAEQLIQQAMAIGVAVSMPEALKHIEFLDWLLEQNTKLNLTAITSMQPGIALHLVDSLAAVQEIERIPPGPVLDLGTGGGLPGIPLAIHTGRHFALLDATEKKAAALQEYLRASGLDACAVAGRAEEYAVENPGAYAGVVARAVTSLPSLVELASPLLQHGGMLVCLKGDPEADEIQRGERAAAICGLAPRSVRRLELPGNRETRTIVTYVRTGEPSIDLPRRVGRAQKKPLA